MLKDPDISAVADSVTGTVDPTSGALSITASASTPERAQQVAAAYSQAFENQIQSIVEGQIANIHKSYAAVNAQIAQLEPSGATPSPSVVAEVAALNSTAGTLLAEAYTIQAGEPYASTLVNATLPTAPTGLTKSKLLGIGLLAGLLAGIGIALVRDQFDNRLRTSPDVEAITTAPILAELPSDSEVRNGKVSIALVQAPQSQVAESIRELRTSLRVILEGTPSPLIVVTSPEPGDGKTFVAANLATAWAMSGSKVIVVSADFRRPRLEEIFGLQATGLPGLADLIRSNWKSPDPARRSGALQEPESPDPSVKNRGPRASLKAPRRTERDLPDGVDGSSVRSLLVETGVWGLQVLPAGTHLNSPSELFGSPGIQPVLDQLAVLADVVILDTPPVLPVPDTAILGRMADGTVVVASEGRTDRGDLERTINRLETTQCRVLGVALNRVRHSANDPYQSYAYKQ